MAIDLDYGAATALATIIRRLTPADYAYALTARVLHGTPTAQKTASTNSEGPRTLRFLGLYRLRGQDLNLKSLISPSIDTSGKRPFYSGFRPGIDAASFVSSDSIAYSGPQMAHKPIAR